MAFRVDIEQTALRNKKYRRILKTGKHMQLVVMSLKAGEDIPEEVHDGDQFIRVEEGTASVKVSSKRYVLQDGDAVLIPAGKKHYVKNAGNKPLKLYTIYSPPEH